MFPQLLEKLQWRYATKQFDLSKKVSDEDLHTVLEAARLAPSSFGLQPWKFVVIKNSEIRQKLRDSAQQPQITDSTALVVLCSLKEMTPAYVQKYIDAIAVARHVDAMNLDGFKQMMLGFVANKNQDELRNWMTHQVYIALGTLLTACAINDIDACPMEGFNPQKFNEILELDTYGIESRVLCAIGYRDQKDQMAQMEKVRFAPLETIIEL